MNICAVYGTNDGIKYECKNGHCYWLSNKAYMEIKKKMLQMPKSKKKQDMLVFHAQHLKEKPVVFKFRPNIKDRTFTLKRDHFICFRCCEGGSMTYIKNCIHFKKESNKKKKKERYSP